MNGVRHEGDLGEFLWTGKRKMKCVAEWLGAVVENGDNEDIERLMVVGKLGNVFGMWGEERGEWLNEM